MRDKKLVLGLVALIILTIPTASSASNNSSSSYFIIQDCPDQPFCINQTKYPNPSVNNGSIQPGEEIEALWEVNATGSRGAYNVSVLVNSTNPNVGTTKSSETQVTVFEKGIIPNEPKTGHPFFVQSGDENPQACQGSFNTKSVCRLSSQINATGPFGNYTVFFIANSTNPNVDTELSSKNVVEIIKDGTPPLWRNLQDDQSAELVKGSNLDISVEVKDDISGVYKAVLATNETGTWVNHTQDNSQYGSPEIFSNVSDQWLQADYMFQDNNFQGDLGYKVWVRDKVGNWNVTDIRTQEIIDTKFASASQNVQANSSKSREVDTSGSSSSMIEAVNNFLSTSIFNRYSPSIFMELESAQTDSREAEMTLTELLQLETTTTGQPSIGVYASEPFSLQGGRYTYTREGLQSYYTFDKEDVQNNTLVDIFGVNNGTINGTLQVKDSGPIEEYGEISPETQVKINDSGSLNPKQEITVEAWVK